MQIDVSECGDYFVGVVGFAVRRDLLNQLLRQFIFLITFVDGRKSANEITRARFQAEPPKSFHFVIEKSEDEGNSWTRWFGGEMQYEPLDAPPRDPASRVNVINPSQGEGWCLLTDGYSIV